MVINIYDGHGSHLSIEAIEKAKKTDIHFLCLPSHCTHLLQPLDVSVMFSLKTHFGKACKRFLAQNVGRAITEADLACLVGQAWPLALTPSNLMSGFCKSGIYPLNPGRIVDRHMAPSHIFVELEESPPVSSHEHSSRSEESPQSLLSVSSSQLQVSNSSQSDQPSIASLQSSRKTIDEILSLPKPTTQTSKRKVKGLTSTTQVPTDTPFLDRLKERKAVREEIGKKAMKSKAKSKSKSKVTPRKQYQKRKTLRTTPTKKTAPARETAAGRLLARISARAVSRAVKMRMKLCVVFVE